MPLFTDQPEKYRRKPTFDFWPFSYQGSVNLHWERALLELENLHDLSFEFKAFLRAKFNSNSQTDIKTLRKLDQLSQSASLGTTEKIVHTYSYCVDWLNLFRNTYEILALSIKPLALQLPFIGLAWQVFDATILTTMAIYTRQKEDKWASNHYSYTASQLLVCSGLALSALILATCSLLSIMSTLATAIGGITALIISWALSERAAKLCDARIDYLIHEELSMQKLPIFTDADAILELQNSYQTWHETIQKAQNSEASYRALMTALQHAEKHLEANKNNKNNLDDYHQAKLTLSLCKNQMKKREFLYRLETPLNFLAVAAVALSVLALVLFIIGANMATFGLASAIFCSAIVIFSSIYNLHQKNKLSHDEAHSNHEQTSNTMYPHTLFDPLPNDTSPQLS
ncbi:hypothetical protein [Caedibacter taeniospiralis]|jgi:hypothetical protein|uniref:hypothetical protein n=1 Tax=Caedibacter taeniospiralis TaxID=28907 RepID=UPI0037C1A691